MKLNLCIEEEKKNKEQPTQISVFHNLPIPPEANRKEEYPCGEAQEFISITR